ncbi:hypothetical protein V5O48_010824 [Marasmius crinis-equi]|uniref:Uncharacterized protein n=1 Tax=Marasmius crinis-equi TaxID=585013 RepID=A0ABR3F7A0_9AGAR
MESTSYFANSRGLVIGNDGNFATVHGNQILNYFNREPERKTALTIYDQFRQVMLGDIFRINDFGVYKYPRLWNDGKPKADKTICAAQVIGGEGRVFTMITYAGPEAQDAFQKDFQMYARRLTAGPFQVYGINTNVPTVLFYDERQPLAKFLDGLGSFGKLYLQSLKKQFHWHKNEIWLDPKKGELCQGPAGPECDTISEGHIPWENLSCSAKLLEDGNCLSFLAGLKARYVDREVVKAIGKLCSSRVSEVEVHQPTICSASTNTTVAVSGGLWESVNNCLSEREVMENGATRFTLKGEGVRPSVWIDSLEEWGVWMSQALSINDDLSQCELIYPDLRLGGHLSTSENTRLRRRGKSIYLFVHPLSTSTPTEDCWTCLLHHWSFDPTGQRPLPAEICEDLGLPIELTLNVQSTKRHRWTNEAYKRMHQYQLARGFDPKTTDFAQHLGLPIYQVQSDSDRFEDVDGKPGPPKEGLKGRGTALRANINSQFQPKATTTSSNPRLTTKSMPSFSVSSISVSPPKRPEIQSREPARIHRTATRGAAKPGITSGKVTPASSRTRTPLPPEPVHIASSSPKLRTPRNAETTPASTRSASPSSSIVRISRRPRPASSTGTRNGTEGNIRIPGTQNTMKTPSKQVRQCRDPTIPTRPTARPTNDHERSSSSSQRVWR